MVVTVSLLKVHRAENKLTILRTTCIRNTEIIFKQDELIRIKQFEVKVLIKILLMFHFRSVEWTVDNPSLKVEKS